MIAGAGGAMDALASNRVAGSMILQLREQIAGQQILHGSEDPSIAGLGEFCQR
jgi:hypothetical protein